MDDTISRKAAIELKPEFLNPNVNRKTKEQTAIDRAYARGWNSCNTHWIKEIIEDLPSAQPERGKGRWLNINESEKWECSECSRIMWFSPRLGVKPSDYRFCPNCGADMREEQE